MRAFLQSQGADLFEMTVHPTFVVLQNRAERNTPAIVAQHEANFKAVNFLFATLGPIEFEKVQLETAREIWATLADHHEGTAEVKARLYRMYKREYENLFQKPGESLEEMFGRFQSIINKLRDNKAATDVLVSDHERALKLLDSLDLSAWEVKVAIITDGASYDTLTVAELFSKLKATEVASQLRSNLSGSGSKTLALATTTHGSPTDPSPSFALSSLLSIKEEQLETLGDDDHCLFNNRVRRVYDWRMMKRNGYKQGCFECGETGHFVADYPKRNDYYKKGTGGGSFDSGNHPKQNDYKQRSKGGSRRKFLKKSVKDFYKGNKQRERAFLAELQANIPSGSSTSSSSSSSSNEDIPIKGKKKEKGVPAGLCFVSSSHKHRRRHHIKSRKSFCTMVHKDKDDDRNGDSDSDGEVAQE